MVDLRAPSQQQQQHLHDDDGETLRSRMTWTEDMVTFLIQVVSDVQRATGNQKKPRKWKSVSNHMMEKLDLSISPKQCKDKFKGLNKSYTRLNDVLGRAKSDQVVKDPSLLNSMDHLLPQDKRDLTKILRSRSWRLYYEEIRNYHSTMAAIAADLGTQSSKSKEGAMNDQNGGNDEDGEDQNGGNDEDGEDLGMQSSATTTKRSREVAADLGMQSSTTKRRIEGAMNDENGGKDEDGQANYDENNRDVAVDLGMQSSTTKSREVAMNDENGGNDEDGEDKNNGDAEAEGIGSYPAKRMKLIKESEGKSYECMISTAPEKHDPVMSCMLLDNARTPLMQPDGPRTTGMQPDGPRTAWMPENELTPLMQPDGPRTAEMQPDGPRTAWMPENELKRLELEIKKMEIQNKSKKMEIEYKRMALEEKHLENEKMRLEIYRMELQLKEKDKDREMEALQLKHGQGSGGTTAEAEGQGQRSGGITAEAEGIGDPV